MNVAKLPVRPDAAIPRIMVDNLALLIAHMLLVLAILRSLRASKDAHKTKLKSWRDK